MIDWKFVVAGYATFTVEPPADFKHSEGQPHFTYCVQRKESVQYGVKYFVKVLTGPDNTRDFTYMGVLNHRSGEVYATEKSKIGGLRLAVAQRVLLAIFQQRPERIEESGWSVHHEGRCGCCGRKLTTPESIATGIGPVCMQALESQRY